MQSNGVQFYLGIYETEIEAAQAYEKKVKESGGHARLVNIFPFTVTSSIRNNISTLALCFLYRELPQEVDDMKVLNFFRIR